MTRKALTLDDLELDKFDSTLGQTYVRTVDITPVVPVVVIKENKNTFSHKITNINTTAISVSLPENTEEVILIHRSDTDIYLGSTSSVTTSNGFQLIKNEKLELKIKKNSDINLFAIAASAVNLYAYAMVKE
jgi:hypothetical protein